MSLIKEKTTAKAIKSILDLSSVTIKTTFSRSKIITFSSVTLSFLEASLTKHTELSHIIRQIKI